MAKGVTKGSPQGKRGVCRTVDRAPALFLQENFAVRLGLMLRIREGDFEDFGGMGRDADY